jgi:hypothetical protein
MSVKRGAGPGFHNRRSVSENLTSIEEEFFGATCRIRTDDRLITNESRGDSASGLQWRSRTQLVERVRCDLRCALSNPPEAPAATQNSTRNEATRSWLSRRPIRRMNGIHLS